MNFERREYSMDVMDFVLDDPTKTKQMLEMLKDRGVKFGVDLNSISDSERTMLLVEVILALKTRENAQ